MSDERRAADLTSRGTGVLCLVLGGVLAWLSWHWGLRGGTQHSVKAGFIGPLALVLGLGFLVSGAEMPLDGIRPRTRVVGVVGSLAGLLNLYLLGFFADVRPAMRIAHGVFALGMIGAWFLPASLYGGEGRVPARAPNEPIEPR